MEKAGYQVGADVAFAMDAATSELYCEEDGMYHFPGERRVSQNQENPQDEETQKEEAQNEVIRSAEEMIALFEELIKQCICS